MCAMEPNLVQTPFFLVLEFYVKNCFTSFCNHRSITSHSHFRYKSSHWSLQNQKYLPPKFQLFHHYQYSFVANTPVVVFLFLGARFYIDSFVLKRKTLIHPKKITFSQSSDVQFMYFVHEATRCCRCWIPSHCFFYLDHIFKGQFFQISTNCSCYYRF